jgi:hypothetical protein
VHTSATEQTSHGAGEEEGISVGVFVMVFIVGVMVATVGVLVAVVGVMVVTVGVMVATVGIMVATVGVMVVAVGFIVVTVGFIVVHTSHTQAGHGVGEEEGTDVGGSDWKGDRVRMNPILQDNVIKILISG